MRIGSYEIVSELGRGGMGIVYSARSDDGRDVAIKVLFEGVGPDALARFEREKRLLWSFGHAEGFVPVIDAGVEKNKPYIVMPLLPGGTLRVRLRTGPLPLTEAIALARTLAQAVGRAHERGVVHRDLKPENVLFTAEGLPLVGDLGLAKHFRRDVLGASQSRPLSAPGIFMGTLGYVPPEQIDDAGSTQPQGDVFSLGVILHECLTGERPFVGSGLMGYVEALGCGPRSPGDRAPPWVHTVLERALARDPGERYADGRALDRALASGAAGRPMWTKVLALAILLLPAIALALVLRPGQSSPGKPSGAPPRPTGSSSAANKDFVAHLNALAAAEDWDAVIEETTRSLAQDPRSAYAWNARAFARKARSDWKGSGEDATRAIELDPLLQGAWINRARARSEEGDHEGQIADATRALEISGTSADAWFLRGVGRRRRYENAGAIADLTRALELDPALRAAWALRADARRATGDREGAMHDLERFLVDAPSTDAEALARKALAELRAETVPVDAAGARELLSRGKAEALASDYVAAIADFTRALERDPTLVPAWLNRSHARRTIGQYEESIADATRASELEPRRAESLSMRSVARRRLRDVEGQISDDTRAIELEPTLGAAWSSRAEARLTKGDLENAILDATRAIELEPLRPWAWSVRATARDAKGEVAAAIADYEQLLTLNPRPEEERSARERVAVLRAKR